VWQAFRDRREKIMSKDRMKMSFDLSRWREEADWKKGAKV